MYNMYNIYTYIYIHIYIYILIYIHIYSQVVNYLIQACQVKISISKSSLLYQTLKVLKKYLFVSINGNFRK